MSEKFQKATASLAIHLFSFQHYLSTTSSQLFALTSSRGRFASATVVLPSSWAGTDCVNSYNNDNSDRDVHDSPKM